MKKKTIPILILIFSFFLTGCSDNYFLQEQKPFYLSVAQEQKQNMESITKFGNNPDIDTTDGFEDIWGGGGHYTGQDPTLAEIVELYSSDVNDANGDTGLWTISIYGLDNDFVEINETVTMNGTNPVNSTKEYLRLFRAEGRLSGSSERNEGIITIRQVITTANVFAKMPALSGQTLISAYTIPANKTAYMVSWHASSSAKVTGFATLTLDVRNYGESWRRKGILSLNTAGTTYLTRNLIIPRSINEKTDIKVSADTSINNMGISAGFDLILIDN